MKPLRILIIDLADDELRGKLQSIFDENKIIHYEIFDLKNISRPEKCLKNKLSKEGFDVFLFTLTADHLRVAEELLGSAAFGRFRKPSIVCIKDLETEKLLKFLTIGIDDFVVAPFQAEDILPRIHRLTGKKNPAEKLLARSKEMIGLRQIIGKNPVFVGEIKKLPVISKCDICVLITGETGTGKEIVARTIHYLSPRAERPFVPVNCGAIPNELVENELFGHERGAFTGALDAHKGLIREADGGTLFLDEIDSLPLISQVKLLRFLQDKEYRLLGSAKTVKADVRIIAASNHNLEELVREEKFRSDLFYRLNVMQVALPPLRERAEDIALLAQHFLEKYAAEFRRENISITPEALLSLQNYEWRGNVRELENFIERAVLLSEEETIAAFALPAAGPKDAKESFHAAKARVVARFERNYLRRILEVYRGNISQAAKAAGKHRRAFFELIRKHRINVENYKS
jgi:two-component system, NtrC family, response regulator GlrR